MEAPILIGPLLLAAGGAPLAGAGCPLLAAGGAGRPVWAADWPQPTMAAAPPAAAMRRKSRRESPCRGAIFASWGPQGRGPELARARRDEGSPVPLLSIKHETWRRVHSQFS